MNSSSGVDTYQYSMASFFHRWSVDWETSIVGFLANFSSEIQIHLLVQLASGFDGTAVAGQILGAISARMNELRMRELIESTCRRTEMVIREAIKEEGIRKSLVEFQALQERLTNYCSIRNSPPKRAEESIVEHLNWLDSHSITLRHDIESLGQNAFEVFYLVGSLSLQIKQERISQGLDNSENLRTLRDSLLQSHARIDQHWWEQTSKLLPFNNNSISIMYFHLSNALRQYFDSEQANEILKRYVSPPWQTPRGSVQYFRRLEGTPKEQENIRLEEQGFLNTVFFQPYLRDPYERIAAKWRKLG